MPSYTFVRCCFVQRRKHRRSFVHRSVRSECFVARLSNFYAGTHTCMMISTCAPLAMNNGSLAGACVPLADLSNRSCVCGVETVVAGMPSTSLERSVQAAIDPSLAPQTLWWRVNERPPSEDHSTRSRRGLTSLRILYCEACK